eukprot:CAMPEP_0196206768 /NCGR_PEP_ID=MMETSP0912-20130531/8010_1 /TAXON_ID=49265 /ORGANISM="Thalassiosira rotula, Strain GSO102" /LENGTH=62 /DNA_ID=CAMNT_0041481355 /DNA_START=476 /DNA_END=664 /DNA_ORIENTATION=-
MMVLMVFMTLIPTFGSRVDRAGMIVLEKMMIIPAAMALRITEVSMISSYGEVRYQSFVIEDV